MAREGASVVVADINRAAAERVAGDLPGAVMVEVDVSDEMSVMRMIETAVDAFGGLDVLHNNAYDVSAAYADVDIVTLDMAVFERNIAVNLKGVVMGCKTQFLACSSAAADRSSTRRRSTGSWDAASARHTARRRPGIVLLTKSVASQYGARGIRCNAVAPGFVSTPATEDVSPEQREVVARSYPMPRLCEPEDVANAVVFLASTTPDSSTGRRSWSTAARASTCRAGASNRLGP